MSGRADSNRRPPAPKAGALPGCATPRAMDANALAGRNVQDREVFDREVVERHGQAGRGSMVGPATSMPTLPAGKGVSSVTDGTSVPFTESERVPDRSPNRCKCLDPVHVLDRNGLPALGIE